MAIKRMQRMRQEAVRQLVEYRRGRRAARDGAEGYRQARAWAQVILCVRRVLKEEAPEKERFMTKLFGLDHPKPRRMSAQKTMLLLMQEFNCSEATLYNWRAEIVELVLCAAVEAGIFQPFQGGKSGRVRKKAL